VTVRDSDSKHPIAVAMDDRTDDRSTHEIRMLCLSNVVTGRRTPTSSDPIAPKVDEASFLLRSRRRTRIPARSRSPDPVSVGEKRRCWGCGCGSLHDRPLSSVYFLLTIDGVVSSWSRMTMTVAQNLIRSSDDWASSWETFRPGHEGRGPC
jgi:hypothetical protein